MKFILFLIILAVLLALAIQARWLKVSTGKNAGSDSATVAVDRNKVQRDLGVVREKAEELKRSVSGETQTKPATAETETGGLLLERSRVELDAGESTMIRVTRQGEMLPAEQLQLSVSPDSNLIVSGGEFTPGSTETTVTIEAPVGSPGGTVNVQREHGDKRSILVDVSAVPASVLLPTLRRTISF